MPTASEAAVRYLLWSGLLALTSTSLALADDARQITVALKDRAKKQIVLHNDFGNLLWQSVGDNPAATLAIAARGESKSKADLISLLAV